MFCRLEGVFPAGFLAHHSRKSDSVVHAEKGREIAAPQIGVNQKHARARGCHRDRQIARDGRFALVGHRTGDGERFNVGMIRIAPAASVVSGKLEPRRNSKPG